MFFSVAIFDNFWGDKICGLFRIYAHKRQTHLGSSNNPFQESQILSFGIPRIFQLNFFYYVFAKTIFEMACVSCANDTICFQSETIYSFTFLEKCVGCSQSSRCCIYKYPQH
jgi:hypothetical protein